MISLLLALGALPQQDLASNVAELLESRCAVCHSPDSDKPRARKKWASANDLAATAADTSVVVPGVPDESELFNVIEFEDMPPSDSGLDLFNDEEKALLAKWITEGAVVPAEAADEIAGGNQVAAPKPKSKSKSVWEQPIPRWISHFHPLIIHFPIALLVAAFLAEFLARFLPALKVTQSAASFCLGLGALSAVPSALLGWLLAENVSHRADEVFNHRWLGTATATAAVFVWWASRRWPKQRLLFLLVLAGAIGATGHTGGGLSYGEDWLKPPF